MTTDSGDVLVIGGNAVSAVSYFHQMSGFEKEWFSPENINREFVEIVWTVPAFRSERRHIPLDHWMFLWKAKDRREVGWKCKGKLQIFFIRLHCHIYKPFNYISLFGMVAARSATHAFG